MSSIRSAVTSGRFLGDLCPFCRTRTTDLQLHLAAGVRQAGFGESVNSVNCSEASRWWAQKREAVWLREHGVPAIAMLHNGVEHLDSGADRVQHYFPRWLRRILSIARAKPRRGAPTRTGSSWLLDDTWYGQHSRNAVVMIVADPTVLVQVDVAYRLGGNKCVADLLAELARERSGGD